MHLVRTLGAPFSMAQPTSSNKGTPLSCYTFVKFSEVHHQPSVPFLLSWLLSEGTWREHSKNLWVSLFYMFGYFEVWYLEYHHAGYLDHVTLSIIMLTIIMHLVSYLNVISCQLPSIMSLESIIMLAVLMYHTTYLRVLSCWLSWCIMLLISQSIIMRAIFVYHVILM